MRSTPLTTSRRSRPAGTSPTTNRSRSNGQLRPAHRRPAVHRRRVHVRPEPALRTLRNDAVHRHDRAAPARTPVRRPRGHGRPLAGLPRHAGEHRVNTPNTPTAEPVLVLNVFDDGDEDLRLTFNTNGLDMREGIRLLDSAVDALNAEHGTGGTPSVPTVWQHTCRRARMNTRTTRGRPRPVTRGAPTAPRTGVTVPNRDKRIRITLIGSAVALSIILTGTAFWLSYAHLAGIAAEHGVNARERAWAWPATVDLFIAIGEIILAVAVMTRTNKAPGIGLTVLGSAASIAVNLAGVGPARPALDYVAAATPPVAAAVAFGAIMWQVHTFLWRHTPIAPGATPVPPVNTPREQPEQAPPAPAVPPVAGPATPVPAPPPALITGKELALILGKSPVTIRRYVMDGKLTPAATDPVRGSLFHPDQRPAA